MDGRQREREWDELKMQVRKDVGKGKGMKQAEGMNAYEEEGGNRQLMMHKEGLGKFLESHNTTTSTTAAVVIVVAAAPA